ncbi:MAG TPA: hypothetical protein VIL84_02200 [Devosiaceae bacterium]
MTIFDPQFQITRNEKRLLLLLEKLLLEECEEIDRNNIDNDSVALSDAEAMELSERIEEQISQQEFWRRASFVEMLAKGDTASAREPYLAGRTRQGKTRALATMQYEDFLVRLGIGNRRYTNTSRMPFEHFLRMEQLLFSKLGITPKGVQLLSRFLNLKRDEIELARTGGGEHEASKILPHLRSLTPNFLQHQSIAEMVMRRDKLAGALTLFANMTVIFTTRDWSATGTMSTMAGAIGLVGGN